MSLYFRYCKNAIFQNFGNIIFFRRFAFFIFFFFSRQLFSAVSRPIYTKFGTNVSSWLRFKQTRAIFEKLKNQVTTAKKTSKFRSNFHPGRHVFARCDETVKVFWKIFTAMTSRVLYLSDNVIVTVQNRPVFSNTWLQGASKKSDFDGCYLDNGTSYGQS